LVRKQTDEERWTELHNEKIHNVARMIRVRRLKWMGFVTGGGKRRAAERFGRKARTNGNQVAFDGIILNWMLQRHNGRI
jgi:hypothetical protein